jgi:hypothetical protein
MSILRDGWFTREIAETIDLDAPGIYEWRIEGTGVYIGKAKVLRNRINAYPRNVLAMLNGRPWHGDPTRSYRPIHHALHQAHESKGAVKVTVLENCGLEERSAREQMWIAKRRAESNAGGPRVLNA